MPPHAEDGSLTPPAPRQCAAAIEAAVPPATAGTPLPLVIGREKSRSAGTGWVLKHADTFVAGLAQEGGVALGKNLHLLLLAAALIFGCGNEGRLLVAALFARLIGSAIGGK